MKIRWNDKYNTLLTYGFILIASSIVFYLIASGFEGFRDALFSHLSVLRPFFYGFIIAYLVNFLMSFFEKLLRKIPRLKKAKKSTLYVQSLILAYIMSAFFIYLFFAFILPQLLDSISGLISNIPRYTRETSGYLESLYKDILLPSEVLAFLSDLWVDVSIKLTELSKQVVPSLISFFRDTALSIWNIILGIIVSIYMLSEKDRFIAVIKKLIFSIFSASIAEKTVKLARRSHKIFSNFLIGKLLDSLIVGILAFIIFSIVGMPYAVLVSFIIATTNIIPFFGPFIGAIPSVIIIFFESPIMALWFLIIILVLQQLDGNFIGPKILGGSLGISPLWILFSIMIGGKAFGLAGLIVGVPLFVIIYSVVKELSESRLAQKNLPVNTDDYINR